MGSIDRCSVRRRGGGRRGGPDRGHPLARQYGRYDYRRVTAFLLDAGHVDRKRVRRSSRSAAVFGSIRIVHPLATRVSVAELHCDRRGTDRLDGARCGPVQSASRLRASDRTRCFRAVRFACAIDRAGAGNAFGVRGAFVALGLGTAVVMLPLMHLALKPDLFGSNQALGSRGRPIFTVQRASGSFCAVLFGSSFQISRALRPALICAFSPTVLRWRGAASGWHRRSGHPSRDSRSP